MCFTRADFEASGLQPVMEVLNTSLRTALAEKGTEPMDPALGPAVRARGQ